MATHEPRSRSHRTRLGLRARLANRARQIERLARLGRLAPWGRAPDLDALLVAADAWEEAGVIKHADRIRQMVAARRPLDRRVSSPGKFEGEGPWVVYLWDLGLEGFADDENNHGFVFRVDRKLTRLFPELQGVSRVVLEEDENGFVYSR